LAVLMKGKQVNLDLSATLARLRANSSCLRAGRDIAGLATHELAASAELLGAVMRLAIDGAEHGRHMADLLQERRWPGPSATASKLQEAERQALKASALETARQIAQVVLAMAAMIDETGATTFLYGRTSRDGTPTLSKAHAHIVSLNQQMAILAAGQRISLAAMALLQDRMAAMMITAHENRLTAQRAVKAMENLQWQAILIARKLDDETVSRDGRQ